MKKVVRFFSIIILFSLISTCLMPESTNAEQNTSPKFVSVSAGLWFAIALDSIGNVWSSGHNNRGQLGVGDIAYRAGFTKVKNLDNVIAIAAGQNSSIALKSDGTVWTWGDNGNGQLGNGNINVNMSCLPVKVKNLTDVVAISAGDSYCTAVTKNGEAWAWGHNYYGDLGDGTKVDRSLPVKILDNVKEIVSFGYDNIAIKKDNTYWTWGYKASQALESSKGKRRKPIKITNMENSDIAKIVINSEKLFYVTNNNILCDWSIDYSTADDSTVEAAIGNTVHLEGGVDIYYEGFDIISLMADGSVWHYVPDKNGTGKFEPIQGLKNIVKMKSTGNSTYCIDSTGNMWSWGDNYCGELGDGSIYGSLKPIQMDYVKDIKTISAGDNNTFIITNDSSFYGCGSIPTIGTFNEYFTKFNRINGLSDVEAVRTDNGELFALKKDSTLWTAIKDNNSYKFTKVKNELKKITNGMFDLLALDKSGTVWAKGSNSGGELGQGNTKNYTSFVKVSNLNNVIDIASVSGSNFALKKDGTVWGWGYNTFDSKTYEKKYNYLTPIKIEGLVNIKSIVGGQGIHGLLIAVKNDGSIWQVSADYEKFKKGMSFIQKIDGINNVADISVGSEHVVALKKDGTVWTWGKNSYGQLGDGTVKDSQKPRQVTELKNIIKVAAGSDHTIALDKDGILWGWGDDMFGQLASGRTLKTATPVLVKTF